MGTYVTQLLSAGGGAQWLALLAAFVWGIISVVLNPCHLAVIPLVAGLISKQTQQGSARAIQLTFALATGTLTSFAAIGIITALAGKLVGDIAWLEKLLAIIFIAVGLNLLGILPLPHFHPRFQVKGNGLIPAFALGLLYGSAHGPCCLAFMAPLVAAAFGMASRAAIYAGLLLFAFGLGHALVIVLAGAATSVMQRYMKWSERSKAYVTLSRISGALVLLAGIYMLAEPWIAFSR